MNIDGGPIAGRVSHNTFGQKLGRKGQETRERILGAMLELVADQDGPPITLTSVAKQASVRLPNLYLYFPDMGELLLVALGRVMETAEGSYLELLRERWPDEGLHAACLRFLRSHCDFWKANARILHMRNEFADAGNLNLLDYRNAVTRPAIEMLLKQMDYEPGEPDAGCLNVATVLFAGIERIATVVTKPHFRLVMVPDSPEEQERVINGLIEAEAEVMCQSIRLRRRRAHGDGRDAADPA